MAMVGPATTAQHIESWNSIGQLTIMDCQFVRISGVYILRLIEIGVALS